jgi:hypothetical protein
VFCLTRLPPGNPIYPSASLSATKWSGIPDKWDRPTKGSKLEKVICHRSELEFRKVLHLDPSHNHSEIATLRLTSYLNSGTDVATAGK